MRWVRRQIEDRAGPRIDSGANDAPDEDVSGHDDAATGGNLVGHGHSRRLVPLQRSLMCTSCADACSAETMDMRQRIRSCLDCADVCDATARLAVRRTGQNIEALRAMLETCANVCDLCAEECERHDHDHCRLCAEMCRECADDCRKSVPTVQ